MTEEGTRSRIMGALLWSMFAAAALVLVLFTFVAAYGDGNRNRYGATSAAGAEMPSLPDIDATPLCPALPPREASAAGTVTIEDRAARVEAWAARRRLEQLGSWTDVPAGGSVRPPDGSCAVTAVIGARDAPLVANFPQRPCADIRMVAACTETIANGDAAARVRFFGIPGVTAADVAASGLPPLVYFTHVLLEADLSHTPYRPAGGVGDMPIGRTHARTPAFVGPGCVLWAGVIASPSDVLGVETVLDCGSPPELSTHNGGDTIWLRPYRRSEGPHVERTDHPAPRVRLPLRRAAIEAALDAESSGT